MAIISALGLQRQQDWKFEDNLVYIARSCLQKERKRGSGERERARERERERERERKEDPIKY
jgi:hypothetical protein